jgi:hypothetical protein
MALLRYLFVGVNFMINLLIVIAVGLYFSEVIPSGPNNNSTALIVPNGQYVTSTDTRLGLSVQIPAPQFNLGQLEPKLLETLTTLNSNNDNNNANNNNEAEFSIQAAGGPRGREGNPFYDVPIIMLAIISLCASLAFLVFGCLLFKHVQSNDASGRLTQAAKKIFYLTICVTACFFLRCIMLLYRVVTKEFLDRGIFYSFAYYVPEILPILVQLSAYGVRLQRKRRHQQANFNSQLERETGGNTEHYVAMPANADSREDSGN